MMWVATTLSALQVDPEDDGPQDILRDGIVYRRLDPDYYAWLRHRVGLAEKAVRSGKLQAETFEQIRQRFNAIHAWAIEHLGKDDLLKAIRTFKPSSYEPPSVESAKQESASSVPVVQASPAYPDSGERPFTQPVTADAVRQVDKIRDRAIALGWSEARLYQNRGRFRYPCGDDYGLVCLLDRGRTLGEVAHRYIVIVGSPPSRTVMRFYNLDAEQPWIRRIDS